jgi:hypothetical protein
MSGDFDDATAARIAAGFVTTRNIVKVACDEGPVAWWNDFGDVTLDDGVTYDGRGQLGPISDLSGNIDLSSLTLSVTVSNVGGLAAAQLLTRSWHLRPVTAACRLFDAPLRNVFASPLWKFSGLLDKATVSGGDGQQGVITLSLIDALGRGAVNTVSIRSDGDQRGRLSTDGLFKGVNSVGRREVYWGVRQPRFKHPAPNTVTSIASRWGN